MNMMGVDRDCRAGSSIWLQKYEGHHPVHVIDRQAVTNGHGDSLGVEPGHSVSSAIIVLYMLLVLS
jgi:hypothetical protein